MSADNQNNPQIEQLVRSGINRRNLLFGTGAVVAAALVASACGSDEDDTTATTGSTAAPGTTTGVTDPAGTTPGTEPMGTEPDGTTPAKNDDIAIAQLAAGLEVLAVATYTMAGDAAGSGALGTVPPAVVEYVTTALSHHQEHLKAWNKVITGAGESEVTEPNATLLPVVTEAFGKVTDVAGAAKLALMLEDIAAQTYLSAIPVLGSADAIMLAGSIQIVDQQHQAILLFALGEYPVPETFQKVDKAAAA